NVGPWVSTCSWKNSSGRVRNRAVCQKGGALGPGGRLIAGSTDSLAEGRGRAASDYGGDLSTWTRLSWKTAPLPMSELPSPTVALTVVPCFECAGHRPLVLATTPGRMRPLTSATAKN